MMYDDFLCDHCLTLLCPPCDFCDFDGGDACETSPPRSRTKDDQPYKRDDVRLPKPQPPQLKSRAKTHTRDGGHRSLTPEQTFDKYKHLLKPSGVLSCDLKRLKPPYPFSSGNIFVYTASYVHKPDSSLGDLKGLSSGKGKTDNQAKTSALFEAVERYSSHWQGNEFYLRANYPHFRDAVHPDNLLGFSSLQYDNRESWNTDHPDIRLRIPLPFDENEIIDWVKVWSLTEGVYRSVPAAFAYLGYPQAEPTFCYGDTNGNAAGVVLEEAILQGFFEVIERDAAAIWFYNRLKCPGVDLESFDDPYLKDLKAYYKDALERDLWVLDITTDMTIPTFVALSCQKDGDFSSLVMGFGCHLDPDVAISRAVTEVNQILFGYLISDKAPHSSHRGKNCLITEDIDSRRTESMYLKPDPNKPYKISKLYPRQWSHDLRDDIETCMDIARENGLEVLMLDLTRSEIGVPTVKIIVPGLCHWWRRLGGNRLYQLPIKMGWLEEPNQEIDMNPRSILL